MDEYIVSGVQVYKEVNGKLKVVAGFEHMMDDDMNMLLAAPWMRREIERIGRALFTNDDGIDTSTEEDLEAVGQFVEGCVDAMNELREQNAELLEACRVLVPLVARALIEGAYDNMAAGRSYADKVLTASEAAIAKAEGMGNVEASWRQASVESDAKLREDGE